MPSLTNEGFTIGEALRFVKIISGLLVIFIIPAAFAQEVTIAQLREFLLAQHKSRQPDNETAERLSSVTLSERLNEQTLSRIVTEVLPGPASVQQLRLLADLSIFAAPPFEESSVLPAPNAEAQREMLKAGAEYAKNALQHLPDFLAIRDTRRFDNRPQVADNKRSKPTIQFHWIGEFKDQITYRNGAEIADDPSVARSWTNLHSGLSSFGEYGPILKVVFNDYVWGSIAWSRWELDSGGRQLAVYRYTVPKYESHYLVDFCCYTNSEDDPRELSFRDHPAYHGEVVLSPDSGIVRRITIEADLAPSAPVLASELAVQYGEVEIDGRSYVCPVRSIVMTAIHSVTMKRIDGVGIERHLNDVRYIAYRKFGSTSRIVANP